MFMYVVWFQREKTTTEQEQRLQQITAEMESGLATIKQVYIYSPITITETCLHISHTIILPQMTESHVESHCTDLQSISTTLTAHKEESERDMEVTYILVNRYGLPKLKYSYSRHMCWRCRGLALHYTPLWTPWPPVV